MSGELRVAIVGAGIAGLASAVFLARAGHRVSVFEKMADLAGDGTGILLKPAGLDVLRGLGLAERVRQLGSPINRVVARSRDGAQLMDLRYADLRPRLHGVGIRRTWLARLLLEAAHTAGAETRFSCGIASLREDGDAVVLAGRDGRTEYGPFDLLLACDGTHSRLRERIAPGARVHRHARGVYSVVAPVPTSLPHDTLLQSQNQLRDGAGLLPIGAGFESQPLVSFFWNARPQDIPAVEALGFSAWCDYIEGFCPEAGAFLRGLGTFQALTFSTTAEVKLGRWHGARTLLMGDAAHALNPQLGLGATMALLDAESLAQSLLTAPGAIAAALSHHEARRRPHVDGYARISRFWSRLDHLGCAPLRRGMFLAMANGYPAMRRRLLEHVCGYAYLPGRAL